MRSIRKSGVTALTAAIALSLGAIPVALTVPAIVGSGEGTTTLTPADLPAGYASAGSLELATAAAVSASATLVPASGSASATTQTFNAANCTPLTTPESDPDLLDFVGKGKDNRGNVVTKPVGLLKGGFGVQDKGTGTSCGRVDSGALESLTLSLGTDAVGVLGSELLASAARLDLDLKGGARVTATATGPAGQFTRILQSGTPLPGDSTNPDVTPCSQRTDSGPDSGANDNCPWPITAPVPTDGDPLYFTSLTLVANTGSFALSGGSDYVSDPAGNRSVFDLVEAVDGNLCVGDEYPLPASEDGTTPEVTVTRLDNADGPSEVCVPYRFTNAPQSAELLKPLDSESSAQFVFDFVWTVDADITLGDDEIGDGLVRRTEVDFDGEDGAADLPTVLASCPDLESVTVEVDDVPTDFPVVNNIDENDNAPDLADVETGAPGIPGKQFACIVTQSVEPTAAKADGTEQVRVTERIYAYGDIRLSKP